MGLMKAKANDQYSERETQRRFEKALRGAFSTPATPLKNIPPKRPKTRRKHRVKAASASS